MTNKNQALDSDEYIEVAIDKLSDTKSFAEKIARLSLRGDVIALSGDLGSGKTAFAKFFINSFYRDEVEVLSPTFNLVLTYETSDFSIWHFDLYRLEAREELLETGIEEAFCDGVSLIEWPEIAFDVLPDNVLYIKLLCYNNNNTRVARIWGKGNWINRLDAING